MTPPTRRPRPPMGQHFLASDRAVNRIVEVLRPEKEDCWLEIGPGHGEITTHLADRSRLVVAVERDADLAASLEESSTAASLRVLAKDILTVSLASLAARHEVGAWRVYGSLPYYITSPILHRLFEDSDCIRDIHVIIQKEVAERLVAAPGNRDYGYLSVATQVHAVAEVVMELPPGVFRPAPRVDSALVALVPHAEPRIPPGDMAAFLTFVQTCFRQKRKTLRNNLVGRFDADSIKATLKAEGLPPLCRAEELTIATLASIFRQVTPVR